MGPKPGKKRMIPAQINFVPSLNNWFLTRLINAINININPINPDKLKIVQNRRPADGDSKSIINYFCD